MAFKTTIKNQRLSHFVASSAVGFADKVHENLAAKLAGLLREGEILPDLRLLQELVARYLEDRGVQLLEADDRYSNDQVIARDLRLEREALVDQLRQRLTDVRHLFRRQLGRERAEAFLPQRTYSKLDAAELIRLATQAAELLRAPEGTLGRSTVGALSGPAELADHLEAEAAQMQQLLDRQEGLHARKKQEALQEKSAEIEAATKAIRDAAGLLASLYIFADLPFHAQRVKRKVNRKAKSEEEAPTGEPNPVPPKALVPGQEEVIVRLG